MSEQLTIDDTAAPQPAYTEQQAREYLAVWGCSAATAGRLTQAFDAETTRETVRETAVRQVDPEPEVEQFDWSNANPDIAVKHEPALAIYANPDQCIVIRRDCQESCQDDHFVFFSPQRAAAVIAGIQRVMRELEAAR
jgi:hypothetical protein